MLVAELLLQRTRADLVEACYRAFLQRYPTPFELAVADPAEVEGILRPLGFRHRALRLPTLGATLVDRHGGRVPNTRAELLELPGVGPYIANAVMAVAFGARVPLVDPNVIRVIERVFAVSSSKGRARDDATIWDFVASLLPKQQAASVGLALVDVGALICRRRRPLCFDCPLQARCIAFRSEIVEPRRD